MKLVRFSKQLGIGLLELMLSLAIIAILLVMAVRYYQSANNSQNINAASDMVNAVKSGVKSYMNSNMNSTTSTTLPTVAQLISGGYLPSSYGTDGTTANPWNGAVCVATAAATSCSATAATLSSTGTFSILLTGIPTTGLCGQVAGRLQSTANTNMGESATCPSTSTTVTATYAL